MKYLLVILLTIVSSMFVGCSNSGQVSFKHTSSITLYIDTLTIRGVEHEVIKYDRSIMHSPECWCLKDNIR